MIPFSKAALEPGTQIGFSVYVPQGARHSVFRDAGELITADDLEELRELEYRALFVQEGDASAAWEYQADRIEAITRDRALTSKLRTEIVFHCAWTSVRHFAERPDRRTYETVARSAAALIDVSARGLSVVLEIFRLAGIQEYDPTCSAHVAVLAAMIARSMGSITTMELECLTIAGLLRDVGMTRLPQEIRECRGRLTPRQRAEVREHVRHGCEILHAARAGDPLVRRIIVEHHERVDGSGYPHGLVADQIHPLGMIVAVADCFGALTTHRSYRRPLAMYEGLRLMLEGEQGNFDVHVIKALVQLLSRAPDVDLSREGGERAA